MENFKITIYDIDWSIRVVSKDDPRLEGNNDGICLYNDKTILVRDDLQYDVAYRVLIHEIIHAILCCQGRWAQKTFSQEEMCEFYAFTYHIVGKIMQSLGGIFYENK